MISIQEYDIKYLLELNEDINVETHTVGDLYYATVDNFFKRPKELAEFLSKFPTDNYNYKLRNNLLSETESLMTRSCGIQQLLHESYFEILSINLIGLLSESNFIPNAEDKSKDVKQMHEQITKVLYYTNFLNKDTVTYKANNIPHFDYHQFSYNMHLSEGVGGGLSFYKFKSKEKYYSDILSVLNESLEEREYVKNILSNYTEEKANHLETKPYSHIIEDECFEMYHTCEYKFNRLIIHEGKYWHSINYDSKKEKNPRYSLVGVYNHENK